MISTARIRLRNVLDRVSARRGRAILAAGDRLLILGYHRVLPVHEAKSKGVQPGMFVAPETLRMHLSVLSEYVDFIHLDDWVSMEDRSASQLRTQCAITFDDGWRDNFDIAFPILKEFNCPATIFLATGYIGTQRRFWPERISKLFSDIPRIQKDAADLSDLIKSLSGVNIRQIKEGKFNVNDVIERVKQKDDRTICASLDLIDDLLGDDNEIVNQQAEMLDWNQIRQMTDSGLVRLGSHTVEHVRLSEQVSEERAVEELRRSRMVIRKMTGQDPKLFCYPNGEHSQSIVALVRQYYSAACTTNMGWARPDDDPFLLPRMCLSEGGSNLPYCFLARLAC